MEGEAVRRMKGEASLLFGGGGQTIRLLFSGHQTAYDNTVMVIFLISAPNVMVAD